MTFTEIINLLDEAHATFFLLLCHHNADPDAIGSAYAFQSLLAKCKPNLTAEIGTGQGISRLSKHILKQIPITVNTQPNVEKANVIVLLDTNTTQQLGQLAERVTKTAAPKIVVDHTESHTLTNKTAGGGGGRPAHHPTQLPPRLSPGGAFAGPRRKKKSGKGVVLV